MIGESKALDPRKYFIVTFALFSNGQVRSAIFFIGINNQCRDYLPVLLSIQYGDCSMKLPRSDFLNHLYSPLHITAPTSLPYRMRTICKACTVFLEIGTHNDQSSATRRYNESFWNSTNFVCHRFFHGWSAGMYSVQVVCQCRTTFLSYLR
jgi:hypothetical protein